MKFTTITTIAAIAALSTAAAVPQDDAKFQLSSSATYLCFPSQTFGSKLSDCQKALNKISSVKATICPLIATSVWTIAKEGNCRIEVYSEGVDAACISGREVKAAASRIVKNCNKGGKVGGITELWRGATKGVRILEPRGE